MTKSEYVTKRRRFIKRKAVDLLGGKCQHCGYKKCLRALHFHHKDRTRKLFGISQFGSVRAWKKVRKELKKCILLCANCHAEQEDFTLCSGLIGMIGHC